MPLLQPPPRDLGVGFGVGTRLGLAAEVHCEVGGQAHGGVCDARHVEPGGISGIRRRMCFCCRLACRTKL